MSKKPDLVKIATGFREGLLDGRTSDDMCFAVTAPLQGLLSVSGIESDLVDGMVANDHHFWLDMRDGNILDPTADQFPNPDGDPMPPVYYGPQPHWYTVKEEGAGG